MLLTARKLVRRKMLDINADRRGTLCDFYLKVGVFGQAGFEAHIRELVERPPRLAVIVELLLTTRRVMRQEFTRLHKMLLDVVGNDLAANRHPPAPTSAPPPAATNGVHLLTQTTMEKRSFVHVNHGLRSAMVMSGRASRERVPSQ